jgi:putative transposase
MYLDSDRHRRRSIRLNGYDYTQPGAYFVTVVTYHRECLFGDVVDGQVRLNEEGEIAIDEWFRAANLRPYVKLFPEEFVVMPNHIHGIIWIVDMEIRRGAATLRPYKISKFQHANVPPKSLGAIVRAYKSAVTYHINAIRNSRGKPIWQRNYYEHIIRDQSELEDIAGYIFANPVHWADDPENIL